MKEWMVGVNGVYWRIKADRWRMVEPTRGLMQACFYQNQIVAVESAARVGGDKEEREILVGQFAGQMVVVFDPSSDVMITTDGGVAPAQGQGSLN